jgi:hypothetical protein
MDITGKAWQEHCLSEVLSRDDASPLDVLIRAHIAENE